MGVTRTPRDRWVEEGLQALGDGGPAAVRVEALAKKLGVAEGTTLALVMAPTGGLWIAWPKKSSGVATDLSDNAIRAAALPRGLVDNKVCALDATWSALRLVWRRENR